MRVDVPVKTIPVQGQVTKVLPEIQGLRAIAVGIVVLFHLWPNTLRGGFVGVDVFFVVSGFLITAHLAREARRGSVNVVEFWARRMRRLLPASLLVLAVIGVTTVTVAPIADWSRIFRHIAASAVYVENWFLASDAVDYWAQAAAAPPTQHYWSLSVEEQFYLVWPVIFAVIALAVRGRRQARLERISVAVLGVIVAAGIAYSIWYTQQAPSAAYFSTFTRAWEFALGGLVALTVAKLRVGERPRMIAGWLGILLVIASAVFITSGALFPGWIALVPTLGAALVLAAGTVERPFSVSRLSSWRPVMLTGDLSYSIYLWHWPLIVFAPIVLGREAGLRDKLVMIVVTFALAWLTKRFVEDPFRASPFLRRRRSLPTFVAALVATGILVASALIVPQVGAQVLSDRLQQAHAFASSGQPCVGAAAAHAGCNVQGDSAPVPAADIVFQDFDPVIEGCFSQDDNDALIECHFGSAAGSGTKVALVGDSHAGALAPALERLATDRGWDLRVYLKPGCPWSDTMRFRPDGNTTAIQNCRTWQEKVSRTLAEQPEPFDLVITTSYAIVGNMVDPDGASTPYDASVVGLRRTWSQFHAANPSAPIVVVRDNPNWDQSPVTCLQHNAPADCVETEDAAFSNLDPQIEAVEGQANVDLLDFTDIYCPDASCRSVIGGVTVYRDPHHLSQSFAMSLAFVFGDRLDQTTPVAAANTKGSS